MPTLTGEAPTVAGYWQFTTRAERRNDFDRRHGSLVVVVGQCRVETQDRGGDRVAVGGGVDAVDEAAALGVALRQVDGHLVALHDDARSRPDRLVEHGAIVVGGGRAPV